MLALVYAENPGIAFGQLQEGGSFGRWFLTVLAGLAAMAVFYYFWRTPRSEDRVLGACALLLAGILGNLTDRVRLGFVVDFILAHAGEYHWPVFNLADASICVGVPSNKRPQPHANSVSPQNTCGVPRGSAA